MKKLLLFTILFTSATILAQKQAAIWYFGENAGLDFNSGSPIAIHDGKMVTGEGCSTISDANGSLLFYSDGTTVWNKNHEVMPNGTDLKGHSTSTQSAIIVPSPGDPDIYYIFTAHYQVQDGIYYNIVDLSLDGGLGDITTKNSLLKNPAAEKLTAVMHANGTDIWVLAHDWGNDAFLAYLVTPTGVVTTPVISNVGFNMNYLTVGSDQHKAIGYLKASPDGTKMAVCHRHVGAELFDFNSATGKLSNPLRLIEGNESYYGVEFSPSSSVLYISEVNGDVSQYNLNAADIVASKLIITQPGEMGGGMQLAIDGKIYMSNVRNVSVINNPNTIGLGCNYEDSTINVEPGMGLLGLPPFIQSYFFVSFNAYNFCLGDATEFSVNVSEPITSILWDFGDGTTSMLETPTNVYANAGVYTVSVTVTTASETKTETKEITIFDKPVANTPSNIEVCNLTANYEVDLSIKDAEILATQSPSNFKVTYHSTFVEAQNGSNELPIRYTNTNETETLFARIFNINNSRCYAITNFDLIVKKAPVLETITDWIECDTDSDGLFQFDFTTKNVEILNGQDTSEFSISYFRNNSDALSDSNPIIGTYQNTIPAETIYFRLFNSRYPECFELGNFKIEVINGVSANSPTAFEICDLDNDGFSEFNLSTKDKEILGIQSPSSFSVSYHATQQDADTGANSLNKTSFNNTMAYTQSIYARVVNNSNSDCFGTSSFQLVINDSPILNDVVDWLVCDTDNDGVSTFDLTQKNTEVLGTQASSTYAVSYYDYETDAMAGTNAIIGLWNNTTRQQQVFYRLENKLNSNCFITDSFSVIVHNTPNVNTVTSLIACDVNKTGSYSFDLSVKDVEVLGMQNPSEYVVSYFSNETNAIANQNVLDKTAYTNQQITEIIYARITNIDNETCYGITSFNLILNTLPSIDLEDTYVICPDSPDLVIDGGDFESWEWRNGENMVLATTQEISITALGNYTLTVTETANGVICSNTQEFSVVSSGAPETLSIDTSGFSDQIELIINALGIGEFEYSIDGINFQNSKEFEVFPGKYTVFVRDAFLCRTLTEEITVIGYQKFFTPNGDGVNDYWNIIGAEQYPNAVITLYDRYGKLLKQLSPQSQGWNGDYLGSSMPAGDYWFKFEYGNGEVVTGHFSLKR